MGRATHFCQCFSTKNTPVNRVKKHQAYCNAIGMSGKVC